MFLFLSNDVSNMLNKLVIIFSIKHIYIYTALAIMEFMFLR